MSTPPSRTLGDHLIRMVKLLHVAKQLTPGPHPEVDPLHYSLLFRVWAEPQRLSDLAGSLHADISTTSRQVSHLTRLGLIEKLPDPCDRRAHHLGITEAGKQLVRDLRTLREAHLDLVLTNWTTTDRDQFSALLDRFATDLDHTIATRLGQPSNQEDQT